MMQWISSVDQCVLVSEALAVSQGRMAGRTESGLEEFDNFVWWQS
jgi:hypothetical protein